MTLSNNLLSNNTLKIKNSINTISFIVFLFLTHQSLAETCAEIDAKARDNETLIPVYISGHKVIGTGRAYIYSAPNEKCYNSQLFLVPGDLLNGYADYNGFIDMMYINPATGKEATGWMKVDRLVKTGTGIGPKEL